MGLKERNSSWHTEQKRIVSKLEEILPLCERLK